MLGSFHKIAGKADKASLLKATFSRNHNDKTRKNITTISQYNNALGKLFHREHHSCYKELLKIQPARVKPKLSRTEATLQAW